MKILHNYILKQVIRSTALVFLLVAALQALILSLNELRHLGQGGYGPMQMLVYVLSSLMGASLPFFSAAALMGCLIGMGKLAADGELIGMQAAGISRAFILRAILVSVAGVQLPIFALKEGVALPLQKFAQTYKLKAQKGAAALYHHEGLWVHSGLNFIHIGTLLSHKHLSNLLRYHFNPQDRSKLVSISMAKSAKYQGGKWVVSDVEINLFQQDQIAHQHIIQQIWPIAIDESLLQALHTDPKFARLPSLYRSIQALRANGLYSKPYEFEFWQRLFWPLVTLAMVGLAAPFIFGSARTKPIGHRILVGILMGFLFYTLNEFAGPLALLYQIPPVLAASIPFLICAGFNSYLILGGSHVRK